MGMIVSMNCRTVALQKELTKTQRSNSNGGTEEAKEIMFRIACQRKYQSNYKDKDGNQTRGRQTDFFLLRARGQVAQVLNDYATKKNGDKLISRFLSVEGTFETYQKEMVIEIDKKIPISLEGKVYNIPLKTKETRTITHTIFNCSSVEFLDGSGNEKVEKAETANNEPEKPIELTADMLVEQLQEALDAASTPETATKSDTVNNELEIIGEDEIPFGDTKVNPQFEQTGDTPFA